MRKIDFMSNRTPPNSLASATFQISNWTGTARHTVPAVLYKPKAKLLAESNLTISVTHLTVSLLDHALFCSHGGAARVDSGVVGTGAVGDGGVAADAVVIAGDGLAWPADPAAAVCSPSPQLVRARASTKSGTARPISGRAPLPGVEAIR
ncbi:hypothetical protein [Actinoplanes sp. ATCC 53533]|uniref:hypothetical protein n=1 Tax=Actinoplanes sp. ATCC 53533 TaxID=1288362 RepID=UPI000F793E22|nr:hypothetical protein [Actinoplanes sp. ATCC 53533]